MIQRIQTIFLIIASILLMFVVFMPIADFMRLSDDTIFQLGFNGLAGEADKGISFNTLPLSILISLTLGITVSTIFLYKRRMLQIRLCIFNIIMLLGLIGLMFYYSNAAKVELGANVSYSVVFIFPLVGAILVFLALRAIARDEALVRSLNRLR